MIKKHNSLDRLRNPDEIFTPPEIVELMLNQTEILNKIYDITATFLEPAAGDGAFLVRLLRKRMEFISKQNLTARDYGEKCLLATSSLYGIELLNDNVNKLIQNMMQEFSDNYSKIINKSFDYRSFDNHVIDSARTIIKANMVQGDALKKVKSDGNPIILSEWLILPNRKVKRVEYTFDAIINDLGPVNKNNGVDEQLDLFSESFDDNFYEYLPVNFIDIYKEKMLKKN